MIVLIMSGPNRGKIGTMDQREILATVNVRLASGESVTENRKNLIPVGTENVHFKGEK